MKTLEDAIQCIVDEILAHNGQYVGRRDSIYFQQHEMDVRKEMHSMCRFTAVLFQSKCGKVAKDVVIKMQEMCATGELNPSDYPSLDTRPYADC